MSIRDISLPEAIKKAEEFTEHIKDGTIKNMHTRIYRGEFDDAYLSVNEKFNYNSFNKCEQKSKSKKYFIIIKKIAKLFYNLI